MVDVIIETKGLTKKVKGKPLVDDINVSIVRGEICGLIGPNGAGKTTIMKLLTGLLVPTSGKVKLNKFDVNKQRKEAMVSVGAIIESPIFFEFMTGRGMLQNLARLHGLNKQERQEKVVEVLSTVGLNGRGDEKISTYSLGMKQRLGIAQALLGDPEIIILDEPANGLDPMGMKELRELILYLNKEKNLTFLISSHLLDELQKICTTLIIIKQGNVLFYGKQDEIYDKSLTNLEDIFIGMMS
ncbi:ABC transporter ATP-binding protein [Alkalicoccobacillus porphyridii]|uniref:ABC transporter ATP-binding protein n=1 Tax=Alkalicoccobacillus porphyridii TaxID=2597270 RepID=UPI003F688596